jgi:drug/metabolite transporter (DMT)-like permease
MLLFNLIIKKTTALAVSSNTFIIPLVAVFWGILNEEVFTWNSIAGLLLIIVSLIVIIKPPKKGEDIKRG